MFSALARELYDFLETKQGIDRVWGFPNDRSGPGFTAKLGWRMMSVMPLMVMPIRPFTMVLRTLPSLNRLFRSPAAPSKTDGDPRFSTEIKGLYMDPIAHFDDAFDTLWRENATMASVMQVRDGRYLQWRYLGVPEFGYRPFAVIRHGRLLGYLVIRMMDLKGRIFGVLMDIFPFPMESGVIIHEVFSFARRYVKAHGGEFLTCLPPHGKMGILKRAGFRKVPEFINPKTWRLGYRWQGKNHPEKPGLWHVTYGDTDVV